MSRIIAAVFGLVMLVLVGVVVILGAFPPHPRTEQVEHVLPNDKFQPR